MASCKGCGAEFVPDDKREVNCPDCQVLKRELYYGYNELRFAMWEAIRHHQIDFARDIYKMMCAEEGTEWTNEVLGDALLREILG